MAQGDSISGMVYGTNNAYWFVQPSVGQVWLITHLFLDCGPTGYGGHDGDVSLWDGVKSISMLSVDNGGKKQWEGRLFINNKVYLKIFIENYWDLVSWSGVQFK